MKSQEYMLLGVFNCEILKVKIDQSYFVVIYHNRVEVSHCKVSIECAFTGVIEYNCHS